MHTRVGGSQRSLPSPISEDLIAALRSSVGGGVGFVATEALLAALPEFLQRSLLFTVTNVLTRGLTHSIAPTLVSTLLRVDKAHLSRAMAATHSFGAFFSDYYGAFYSKHQLPYEGEKK